MNEYISEDQWDQLAYDQKGYFKEELGKEKYPDNYLPEYSEILLFLGSNNKLREPLGDLATPEQPKEINELWEMVMSFFNTKRSES